MTAGALETMRLWGLTPEAARMRVDGQVEGTGVSDSVPTPWLQGGDQTLSQETALTTIPWFPYRSGGSAQLLFLRFDRSEAPTRS